METVFLELSQNSSENPCARVSFLIKLQAWGKMTSMARQNHLNDSGVSIKKLISSRPKCDS